MQSLRIKTMSLHMPSRSLRLEGEAELQHRGMHGDRGLLDCVSQDRRWRDQLEISLRRKRSRFQARISIPNPLNQQIGHSQTFEREVESSMVEIAHEPLKRVVVRELVKYDNPQQLVNSLAIIMKMGQPILLNWCEGVVFVSQPIPPPEMPEEYAKGELYIASISFAPMSDFSHNVKAGNMEMPVIDVSRSPLSQEIGRFLKSHME